MAAWGAWMEGLGAALLDPGNAFGASTTIHADGSTSVGGGANPASGYTLLKADSLDEAVNWCEEQILASHAEQGTQDHTIEWLLTEVAGSSENGAAISDAFSRLTYPAGAIVIAQDQPAPGFFFVESGTLTAQLRSLNGTARRLRTMLPATVLGEISLYRGGNATAEVVAETDATVLHLSPEDLAKLERDDPGAAAVIHRLAARTLASRLIHAERALRTLKD